MRERLMDVVAWDMRATTSFDGLTPRSSLVGPARAKILVRLTNLRKRVDAGSRCRGARRSARGDRRSPPLCRDPPAPARPQARRREWFDRAAPIGVIGRG